MSNLLTLFGCYSHHNVSL